MTAKSNVEQQLSSKRCGLIWVNNSPSRNTLTALSSQQTSPN